VRRYKGEFLKFVGSTLGPRWRMIIVCHLNLSITFSSRRNPFFTSLISHTCGIVRKLRSQHILWNQLVSTITTTGLAYDSPSCSIYIQTCAKMMASPRTRGDGPDTCAITRPLLVGESCLIFVARGIASFSTCDPPHFPLFSFSSLSPRLSLPVPGLRPTIPISTNS